VTHLRVLTVTAAFAGWTWQAVAVPPRKPSAVVRTSRRPADWSKALSYAQEVGARAGAGVREQPEGLGAERR
jgi:hypothetical protein